MRVKETILYRKALREKTSKSIILGINFDLIFILQYVVSVHSTSVYQVGCCEIPILHFGKQA